MSIHLTYQQLDMSLRNLYILLIVLITLIGRNVIVAQNNADNSNEILLFKALQNAEKKLQSDWQQSMNDFDSTINFSKKIGSQSTLYAYLTTMHILQENGINNVALIYGKKAIRYFSNTSQNHLKGPVFSKMGKLHVLLQDKTKALLNFQAALKTTSKVNTAAYGEALLDIGLFFLSINNISKSNIYLDKASYYFEKNGDRNKIAHIHLELAKLDFSRNKAKNTSNRIKKLKKLVLKIEDFTIHASYKLFISEWLIHKKQFNEALINAKEALQIAKRNNAIDLMAQSSKQIAIIYKAKSDWNNAFLYFEKYENLREANTHYKKNTTNVWLKSNSSIDNTSTNKKWYDSFSFWPFVFLTCSLSIAGVAFYKINLKSLSNNESKQKNTPLTSTNNNEQSPIDQDTIGQLSNALIQVAVLNDFLTEIKKDLEQSKQNQKGESLKATNAIIRKIKASTRKDVWQEFEMRIQQIHNSFYTNLCKEFPELTPNERKLCVFLKLNLSSKEIAQITGKSTNSIIVARYRLRSKLGITNSETNLIEFINRY
jgi:hypothetical protein